MDVKNGIVVRIPPELCKRIGEYIIDGDYDSPDEMVISAVESFLDLEDFEPIERSENVSEVTVKCHNDMIDLLEKDAKKSGMRSLSGQIHSMIFMRAMTTLLDEIGDTPTAAQDCDFSEKAQRWIKYIE